MKDQNKKRLLKTVVSLILVAGMSVSGSLGIIANAGEVLPKKYDLRDDGLVTPVKFQNPWGTCWAFGGIAAIETSLLSYMGETNESYKAKNNGKDFDLSEKHLAWFALHPVTEDICSTQKGEGVYSLSGSTDQEEYYNGGAGILIGTLLSSGIGPVYEEQFPYMGKEKITQKDYYLKNPEVSVKLLEQQFGMTTEEIIENGKDNGALAALIEEYKSKGILRDDVTADNITADVLKKAFVALCVNSTKNKNCYSQYDDWTIDEKDKDGNSNRNLTGGFVLKDANTLPEFSIKDKNGKWTGINEDGIRAIKQELLEGRGIICGFCADASLPGQKVEETFMDTQTWAHYTFSDERSNHCVCIIGWDDTYSKDNFIKGHRPPGDGAWIVKNSWGSETDYTLAKNGEKIGCDPWGVVDENGKHTGYFYISYYDKSIEKPETISFTANISAAGNGRLYAYAYDYMPSAGLPVTVKDNKVIKTAAVFKNENETDLNLVSFSTKTASPNAQVVYELYKLKNGAKSPEDGQYLGKRRAFYPYAGFHREDMMKGITIKKNESFAIVATETEINDDGKRVYEYAINNLENKSGAQKKDESKYGVGIVNKGENFLYRNGQWFDWADVMYAELSDAIDDGKLADSPDDLAIDNFSIKAYLVDVAKDKKVDLE